MTRLAARLAPCHPGPARHTRWRAGLAAAALVAAGTAAAADRHWSQFSCPTGGAWLNTCWASAPGLPAAGSAPRSGDTAWIGGGVSVQYLQPAGLLNPLASLRLDGTLTLADPLSALVADSAVVGTTGAASVVHSAGRAQFGQLSVRSGGSGLGSYTLQGSAQLSSASTVVGQSSNALFEQLGGTHTVTTTLTIGRTTPFSDYRLAGGTLQVGQTVLGMGRLSLRGGTLRVGSGNIEIGSLEVGAGPGGFQLTVDGAAPGADNTLGAITANDTFIVGRGFAGTVVQRSGVVVAAGDTSVGSDGGTGRVTVEGGLFTVGGRLFVGGGGEGRFAQTGGVVNVGSVLMSLGNSGRSAFALRGGELNVVTLLGSRDRSELALEGGRLGTGLQEISVGALDIAAGSGTSFALRVDRSGAAGSAAVVNARQVLLGAGGTLRRGDGALNVQHVDNAGLLALGGPQSFVSLLQRPGSTLELAGPLFVEGLLTLAGTLRLAGAVPASGVDLDLLDWGTLSGRFDAIDASAWALGPEWVLDTSRLYVDGVLRVAPMPEPATAVLLLAGGALLWARRRHCGPRADPAAGALDPLFLGVGRAA